MQDNRKINIVSIIIEQIKNNEKLNNEKIFMLMHENLCNDVLYNDPKYKESVIIVTHILNNLISDFTKEVHSCVNKEGVYGNE